MKENVSSHKFFNTENLVLFIFILFSLTISLLPVYYGFFRDELYYIALSKHLAFGYVDVPPLMPFCIAIVRFFFGESIFAMHIIPATLAVIVLILTREIVKQLGGKLFAQTLALLCLIFAPFNMYVSSYLTYDCFDHLFWALCLYMLVLLLNSDKKKYWIYFGIFAGLGLMSKFGMLWLGTSLVLAMILTPERKYFRAWQFWIGGIIALLIVSPYLIWIALHQFLTIKYFIEYANATAPLTVLSFFYDLTLSTNPLTLPIWALGIYYFFFDKIGRKYRLFSFIFIITFIICIIQQAKFYTITPLYPILLAGGAILLQKITQKFVALHYIRIVYAVLIVLFGVLVLPVTRPVLPVNTLIKYLNFTHLYQPNHKSVTEKFKLGILPQTLADSFGWKEMTEKIAKVYYSLPEKERKKTFIYASNYGEASAIYFYGQKYHLPMPISQHLQYYLWGYRNAQNDFTLITVGRSRESLLSTFKEIKKVGEIYNKYAVPYENGPIFLCRGFKLPSLKIGWEKGGNMHM